MNGLAQAAGWLSLGLFASLLAGCGSPHPGYPAIGQDQYFRLYHLGDEGRTPHDSDQVRLLLRASVHGDAPGTLLSGEYALPFHDLHGSALGDGLVRMHAGDSAGMIVPAERVPWSELAVDTAPGVGLIAIEMALLDVRSLVDARQEAAVFEAWQQDGELQEQVALGRFLEAQGMDSSHRVWPGIHLRVLREGHGPRMRTGDVVSIHYTGMTVGGDTVEDSRARGEALSFRLGDQGQVVEGLDAGVRRMRRGGHALLVVPSRLAFGHQGSAGGIVPPFTTLVYDVEVLPAGD